LRAQIFSILSDVFWTKLRAFDYLRFVVMSYWWTRRYAFIRKTSSAYSSRVSYVTESFFYFFLR